MPAIGLVEELMGMESHDSGSMGEIMTTLRTLGWIIFCHGNFALRKSAAFPPFLIKPVK